MNDKAVEAGARTSIQIFRENNRSKNVRCIYIENFRVYGKKPYVSENLPFESYEFLRVELLKALFPRVGLAELIDANLATLNDLELFKGVLKMTSDESALPPAPVDEVTPIFSPIIEPRIEELLLRIETPTRVDVANGSTVVYSPNPDVLWVCGAYRRLRNAPVDEVQNLAIALHATEVENTWAEVPFSELVNWSQDSYRVRAKKIITRLRSLTKEKT